MRRVDFRTGFRELAAPRTEARFTAAPRRAEALRVGRRGFFLTTGRENAASVSARSFWILRTYPWVSR